MVNFFPQLQESALISLSSAFLNVSVLLSGEMIGVSHIVEPPPQGSGFFFPLYLYFVESTNRYVDGQLSGLVAPSSQGSNLPILVHFFSIHLPTSGLSRKMDPLPSPGK